MTSVISEIPQLDHATGSRRLPDADARLAEQTAAVDRHNADLAALAVANAELAPHQAAVDRVAAMHYTSGSGQFAGVSRRSRMRAALPRRLRR